MQKFFLFSLIISSTLIANPRGGVVKHGNVTIEPNGAKMTVRSEGKAIIDWKEFSVQFGEETHFIQSGDHASVFNRVTGSKRSLIEGLLKSNGPVILANPQGVFVTKTGVVDVQDFMATTLDMPNEMFLQGNKFHLTGDSPYDIINEGKIQARDGDVTFIAARVDNQGSIEAPKGRFNCGVGYEVFFHPDEQEHIFVKSHIEMPEKKEGYTNSGVVNAVQTHVHADGNLYHQAIKEESKVVDLGIQNEGVVVFSAPDGSICIQTESQRDVDWTIDGRKIEINQSKFSPNRLTLKGEKIHLDHSNLHPVHNMVIESKGGESLLAINSTEVLSQFGKTKVGSKHAPFKEIYCVGNEREAFIEGTRSLEIYGDKIRLNANDHKAYFRGAAEGMAVIAAKDIELKGSGKSDAHIIHYGIGDTKIKSQSFHLGDNTFVEAKLGKLDITGDVTVDRGAFVKSLCYPIHMTKGDLNLYGGQIIAKGKKGGFHWNSKGNCIIAGKIDQVGDGNLYLKGKKIVFEGGSLTTKGNKATIIADHFEMNGGSMDLDSALHIDAPIFRINGKGDETYIETCGIGKPITIHSKQVELYAGDVGESSAVIRTMCDDSPIKIDGSLKLISGNGGEGSVAEIMTDAGSTILVDNRDSNLPIVMRGGSGYYSSATLNTNLTGKIEVHSAAPIYIHGGNSEDYGEAGLDAGGPILVNAERGIYLYGGEGLGNNSAHIAAGNMLSPIVINGNVTVRGGKGARSESGIWSRERVAPITIRGTLDLEGGTGKESSASILVGPGSDLKVMGDDFEKSIILSGKQKGGVKLATRDGGNISLTAGKDLIVEGEFIHLKASGILHLDSQSGETLINLPSRRPVVIGEKGVHISSELGNVEVRGNSLVKMTGKGKLCLAAGKDIVLDDRVQLATSSKGHVDLVVDKVHSTPYEYGNGALFTSPDSVITTNGGQVNIYASQIEKNQILGSINRKRYKADPTVFGPLNEPFVYYPAGKAKAPLAVYYKTSFDHGEGAIHDMGIVNAFNSRPKDFHVPSFRGLRFAESAGAVALNEEEPLLPGKESDKDESSLY